MIKAGDRQASERRELAQSRGGYVVHVALSLALCLLGVGFGNAVVFQTANADSRIGAVVQISRGRVPQSKTSKSTILWSRTQEISAPGKFRITMVYSVLLQ